MLKMYASPHKKKSHKDDFLTLYAYRNFTKRYLNLLSFFIVNELNTVI